MCVCACACISRMYHNFCWHSFSVVFATTCRSVQLTKRIPVINKKAFNSFHLSKVRFLINCTRKHEISGPLYLLFASLYQKPERIF